MRSPDHDGYTAIERCAWPGVYRDSGESIFTGLALESKTDGNELRPSLAVSASRFKNGWDLKEPEVGDVTEPKMQKGFACLDADRFMNGAEDPRKIE